MEVIESEIYFRFRFWRWHLFGRVPQKKGQDSQKKSQSGNISPIWGEAPTVPIETKICVVGSLPDVITCAKFQVEIFKGYDFTGGRISHFPIVF